MSSEFSSRGFVSVQYYVKGPGRNRKPSRIQKNNNHPVVGRTRLISSGIAVSELFIILKGNVVMLQEYALFQLIRYFKVGTPFGTNQFDTGEFKKK